MPSDERQVRIDYQLSTISRAMHPRLREDIVLDEDEIDGGTQKDASPLLDDLVVLSGRPSGAHPINGEVPWDFEAQDDDDEDEVVKAFQRGTPAAVENMVIIGGTD